jgi:hypothetical protein
MGQASIKRGGSWNNNPNNCRSAYRNNNNPDFRNNNNVGFRVVSRTLHLPELKHGNVWGVLKESPDLFQWCFLHPKKKRSQLA